MYAVQPVVVMLQVIRIVVHGFLFGLLILQFDFIKRILQTFLLEAADKWNAIPLLPCCNTRLAQLRRLRFPFQLKPPLPHYALLMRKNVPSLVPTFILSRYHIAYPPSYDLLAPPKSLM